MQVKGFTRICVGLLLLVAGIAFAEEVLSQEFLEYLAEFETDSGEWLDPEDLELMASLGEDNQKQNEVNDDE